LAFVTNNLTMILAIGGALLLALLLFLLFKLLGTGVRGRRGSRLGISEYYEVDKFRRLVLIRRDEIEHLIMIGGGEDLVIESNIGGDGMGSDMQSAPATNMRPPPRPAVFGGRRPPMRPADRQDPEM
jgi:hypothetical protein